MAAKRSVESRRESLTASLNGIRVRLFCPDDIPALEAKAKRPLVSDATSKKITKALNLAFFAAYVAAERERIRLAQKQSKTTWETVRSRARDLLKALGLPSEPQSYTRQYARTHPRLHGRWLQRTPIGVELGRTVYSIAPLPLPEIREERRDLDETKVKRIVRRALRLSARTPLSERMVPSGIAEFALPYDVYPEFIYPISRSLAEHTGKDGPQIEAELAVEMLLEIAPSGIALIIALASILLPQASDAGLNRAGKGPPKPNYRRTFRSELFRELAHVYQISFNARPNIVDNISEPGPATDWVESILAMAAQRHERISIVKARGRGGLPDVVLADETERQRLLSEIDAVHGLRKSVKAKRLGEGWRLYQRTRTGPK